ncbi:tyrosine-type recombinase/integrase [Leeuwenhoekiella sp. NPDC079379]|uniref:tyrosine-type recombinase/integrase n=1 Tax=Leeuwenhoekiella sp. NPDC079379 TaxID=3364122 RepID=UPI0037CB80D7
MAASTYLDFDKTAAKGLKLIRSGDNPTFGLLVIVGINLGLRISDLLELTFGDLRSDSIDIVEGKTGKKRTLTINDNIKAVLKYFDSIEYKDSFKAFRSQKGSVYSPQHVNRLLKEYFNSDTSSHSLRKTFGRRVWNNNNKSDEALMYLSEIFNHTSPAITRKYLGIRSEEISDIYKNL